MCVVLVHVVFNQFIPWMQVTVNQYPEIDVLVEHQLGEVISFYQALKALFISKTLNNASMHLTGFNIIALC